LRREGPRWDDEAIHATMVVAMQAVVRSDQGQGPAVVYVPGIDGSGEMLMGATLLLAERFRLVRLSFRHEPPDCGRDRYDVLAAEVVRRLDDLGIARAVLLAESFGGAVALQTALDHPARVAGIAIVNSFAHYGARVRLALGRALLPRTPKLLLRWGRRLAGRRALFGDVADPATVERITDSSVDWLGDDHLRKLRMIAGLDLRPRLPEITQPVTVFAGDRDRVVQSVKWSRVMVARLPDVEYVEIPGGGHVVLPLSSLPWVDWLEKLCRRAALLEPENTA